MGRRQPHRRHPQPVERLDPQPRGRRRRCVADARPAAEPAEHVAADRVVGLLVDVEAEALVDVATSASPSMMRRAVGQVDVMRGRCRSPSMSPTMRSISDSKVTRPAVPPYSSMTSASRTPRRACRRAGRRGAASPGTVERLARQRGGVEVGVRSASALSRSVTCRMPTTSSRSSR